MIAHGRLVLFRFVRGLAHLQVTRMARAGQTIMAAGAEPFSNAARPRAAVGLENVAMQDLTLTRAILNRVRSCIATFECARDRTGPGPLTRLSREAPARHAVAGWGDATRPWL